jgi:hypothetical protein
VLIGAQAGLVALPAAGIPSGLRRFAGRGWSLVLPLSTVVVVVAIALVPDTALAPPRVRRARPVAQGGPRRGAVTTAAASPAARRGGGPTGRQDGA